MNGPSPAKRFERRELNEPIGVDRVRLVLKCLLEGDSDKQIATRLGITRHMVNKYTKAIFDHFDVASSTEL